MLRTLIIHTYAGSLLLGADAIAGSNIFGSYEDIGFGSANTKANKQRFQNLTSNFEFIDKRKDWPDQDLTDTVILAHPPCSYASQQNTSAMKRGTSSDAYDCTRKVLKYGMTNGVAAMAIESVPGALAMGWDLLDHMSEAGGYFVYRILKNSILFGVPQYRERFWAVLVRKDLADPHMTWRLNPQFRTIGSVLDPIHPGTPILSLYKAVDKFIRKLTTEPCRCGVTHGFDPAALRATGLASITGHRRRGFSVLIQPQFFPQLDKKAVCRLHVSPFTSAQPSVLAPGGFAPVLLGSSLWIYRGQPVSQEGYKAIMGFPTDYVFPPDSHYGMRCYLSKGVCPPVASWILDNIRMHLGERSGSPFTCGVGYSKNCGPGRIVSFRPSRASILRRLESLEKAGIEQDDELIDLRNEETDLES